MSDATRERSIYQNRDNEGRWTYDDPGSSSAQAFSKRGAEKVNPRSCSRGSLRLSPNFRVQHLDVFVDSMVSSGFVYRPMRVASSTAVISGRERRSATGTECGEHIRLFNTSAELSLLRLLAAWRVM
jgi:hypothetical protein